MTIERNEVIRRGAISIMIAAASFLLMPTLKLKILFSVFSLIFPVYFYFRFERKNKNRKQKNINGGGGLLLENKFILTFLGISSIALFAASFIGHWAPEWSEGTEGYDLFKSWYELIFASSVLVAFRVILKEKFKRSYSVGFRYFMFVHVCVCSAGVLFLIKIFLRH